MKNFKRILAAAITATFCLVLLIPGAVMAAPPSIGSVSISPDPGYAGDILTATPSADWYDEDGDLEDYLWQWQIWDEATTAWVDITGATTDTLESAGFNAGDQIKVICTPYDGSEEGTAVEDSITISGGIVSIDPDPAYTDSDLTAVPAHWTAETDSFTYQWQIWDGTAWLDLAGETTETLASTYFVKDDQIQVVCTPYSGDVAGEAVTAAIAISNSAPSVESVSISPDPASTESPLEAAPQGWSDADEDPEGYQWQWQLWDEVTAAWVDIEGATASILDGAVLALNDQIQVVCTPFDGTDTGEPVTAAIGISILDYNSGIDVKPGSDDNPINLKSKGVVPVAIYTTEGFDATLVDVSSVRFGPNEAEAVHSAYEDINEDGDTDLILHFRVQDCGIAETDTSVTLTGLTTSGDSFSGTDVIKITPSRARQSEGDNNQDPEQNEEEGDNSGGDEGTPGQDEGNDEGEDEGDDADEGDNGRDSAPGQNKERGENAQGKGKNK